MAARQEAAEALEQYSVEGKETDRVRVDVLKLAGADIEKIRHYVAEAKKDYRDVIAPAVYPEELRSETWKLSPQEVEETRKRDLRQYLAWLKE